MKLTLEKLGGLSVFLLVVSVAFGWTVGKSDADAGLEQRVAGLEARVTDLEEQFDTPSESETNVIATEAPETPHTLKLSLTVSNNFDSGGIVRDQADYEGSTNSCSLSGSMGGFYSGATVSVKNQTGELIGAGTLETEEGFVPRGNQSATCKFTATIDLPQFSFITIEVGGLETDPYSFDVIDRRNWSLGIRG